MWIDKFRKGQRIIGTMIRLTSHSAMAWMAKNAGLDFVMLDLEHGELTLESSSELFRLARALDIGAFIRVSELSKAWVSGALDAGATGVMVPMIDSEDQAKKLVTWSKYAPIGDRGLSSNGGHTNFASIAGKALEFMQKANHDTISIAQIETKGAVESIENIAALPGIDALLVGPNDLANSLGCTGDIMGNTVDTALGKIAKAAQNNGKVFGIHGSDALLARWIPQGLTLVMNNLDINILTSGMREIREKYGQ